MIIGTSGCAKRFRTLLTVRQATQEDNGDFKE
jgi:hypothetical protein